MKFDEDCLAYSKANGDCGMYAGCTACVVFITEDKIFCCNAGDSRAVLKQGKKTAELRSEKTAVGLSEDHKPDDEEEMKRIYSAGHMVQEKRVDGNLALSRAFGDFMYKDKPKFSAEEQAVTADPDITIRDRKSDD